MTEERQKANKVLSARDEKHAGVKEQYARDTK